MAVGVRYLWHHQRVLHMSTYIDPVQLSSIKIFLRFFKRLANFRFLSYIALQNNFLIVKEQFVISQIDYFFCFS